MNLFFAQDFIETRTLPPDESYHCIRVLRFKENDIIQVTDGSGVVYDAKITFADAQRTQILLLNVNKNISFQRHNYRLHVAIAPTKHIDRFEWFVEKAVEIGIDSITPLYSRCSERKVIKMERLEKIIVSAVKQSLKVYLPKLNPMAKFEEFVSKANEEQRFIAHCHNTEKLPLVNVCQKYRETLVMIGPEGDFMLPEIAFAEQHGFKSVSLGTSRLRTETAGIVAVNTISLINGE